MTLRRNSTPMATTFANLIYHIVFSTKNRIPSIGPEIREPLYQYMGGILRGEGGILLEIGGMPDHVHILAKMKPSMAPAEIVKKVKGGSSKWLNERPDRSGRFEWQAGYAAFSVSASLVETVRRYIRRQEEHHREISFRDELITLLERNGIPYDERYLLG
jgi:putative transposase